MGKFIGRRVYRYHGDLMDISYPTHGINRRFTFFAAAILPLIAGTLFLLLSVRPGFSAGPPVIIAASVIGLIWAIKRLDQFVLFFTVFLFVEGMIKAVYPYQVTFFLRDIFLGLIYVIWFAKFPLTRGFTGRYDKYVSTAILIFTAYTLTVTIIPFTNETFFHRLGGARFWLAFIPLFFVGSDLFRDEKQFARFVAVYLAASVVTAVYGIVQYVIGFDHLMLLSDQYDTIAAWSHWYDYPSVEYLQRRVFSTFDLPPFFSRAMQVGCLLAVVYAFRSDKAYRKTLLLGVFVLCLIALILTGTREAYAPLVIALVIYLVFEKNKKQVTAVAILAAASVGIVLIISNGVYAQRLLLLITDFQYTLWRISTDFEKALSLVRNDPFGLGIATSAKLNRLFIGEGYASTYRFIENGYGQSLVSLGWVGFVLFSAVLLVTPIRTGWLSYQGSFHDRRLLLVFAFCTSQLFPMLSHMTLYTGLWPLTYWLAAGAVTKPTRA
jgi:hypothetical protein